MNEGESAGEKPRNIGFTPAVMNRRSIPSPSANIVISVRIYLRIFSSTICFFIITGY